jgi:site-specific DNA recombinase
VRAGIYVRLSSDPRGRGKSVAEQEADSRTDCDKRGWQITAVYRDNNRSASKYATRDREQFTRLLADIRSGSLDVIVAWEASRFVRDTKVYADLAEACVKHNVLMSYNGRVLDLSDPDDAFNAGLDALLSEREAGITRKRIMRTHRFNAEAGLPHGQIAYGYRRVYDSRTGALLRQEPDPVEAVIVREVFHRVGSGETLRSIALSLTARKVKTPSGADVWQTVSLRRILDRQQYLGKRTWNGQVMPSGGWEPLVDEATFARCQHILADPRRRQRRVDGVRHLLSGILICDECEAKMSAGPRNGIVCYICRDGHVARKKELIELPLVRLVKALLADPRASSGTDLTVPLEDEIDLVDQEIAALVEQVVSGELTALMGSAEQRRLEARKADLVLELRQQSPLPDAAHGVPWEDMSLETQREVVRASFSSLRVVKKKGQRKVGRHAPGVLYALSRDPSGRLEPLDE